MVKRKKQLHSHSKVIALALGFHFEARPIQPKSSWSQPSGSWKVVRVVAPCPTCGHGEPKEEIVCYPYPMMNSEEQAVMAKVIADALNERLPRGGK